MKKKKIILLITGILLVVSVFIGLSYALWQITLNQNTENIVNSTCFKVTFTENTNAISLTKAYPILDSEGMDLDPYTFTITNTCNSFVKYEIHEEVLNTTTLAHQFIKSVVDTNTPKVLTNYDTVTPTIQDASNAYNIGTFYLKPNETKTHDIRIWVDETATPADANNKIVKSKITITSALFKDNLCYKYGNDALNCTIAMMAGGTDYIESKGTPDFSVIATTNEGMYMAEDDYGKSYYYRGAVTENNVIFGGFCWKIIRINGNDSIRMIYNGVPVDNQCTTKTGEGTQIGTSAFNESYSDNAYVGYMYGSTVSSTYEDTHANINDSTIKETIDTWYENNLISYSSYLSDTSFCNDRSIISGSGYWSGQTTYRTHNRIAKSPSLKCTNKNDSFTINDTTYGNGVLTYPIALITADEINVAGGLNADSHYYYLYNNENYWTISPTRYANSYSVIFINNKYGHLSSDGVSSSYGVRPVISLKETVTITQGDGTMNNPYIIAT